MILDLILTGSGVQPQIPDPINLIFGDEGFNPEIHLMVGQRAYNVDDNIVYKRTKTGIQTEGYLSDAERAKLAGIEAGATNYTHPDSHPATMITESTNKRFMTDAERTKLSGIADGANNYTHPASHPATMIAESTDKRFMTDAERTKLSQIHEQSIWTYTASPGGIYYDGRVTSGVNYCWPGAYLSGIVPGADTDPLSIGVFGSSQAGVGVYGTSVDGDGVFGASQNPNKYGGNFSGKGVNINSGIGAYHIRNNAGVSGTFTSADGKTITVEGGIITGIV